MPLELIIDFMLEDHITTYRQCTFQQLKIFKLRMTNYILLNFKKKQN